MTQADIAHQRLVTQRISPATSPTPVDVVRWLGAMQAQDYPMARWGIGLRIPGATETSIAEAVDSGRIVRTHVLRPTWHLVAAEDIRWLLALTGTRVRATMDAPYRRLELDEVTCGRSSAVIEQALAGGRHRTRAELMTTLGHVGIRTDDLRSAFLMFHAELSGLVCNGPMRGKQLTYALLDERVPPTAPLSREEAVAELVRRYFTSHGPATARDFGWWSGLTLTDAKAGLAANRATLTSAVVDGITYWFAEEAAGGTPPEQVQLLPAFDEYLVSYADRRAAISPDVTRHAITVNGIFRPVVVVDGRVAGTWQRTAVKDHLRLTTQLFEPLAERYQPALAEAARRYGEYLGVRITLAGV